MKTLLAILLLTVPTWAQPAVAPTGEAVGSALGENRGDYNVRQSYELGYRFHSVSGDEGTYRSTVNFGNGLRLLESSLAVQSRDGHGKWFDQIQLDTQGLGNDPYQNAIFRTEKNRFYRYDLRWRSNAYYNPGLRTDPGHLADTVRNYQDHDFTLLPQSSLKFFLGFSRNTQAGPAITSALLFDGRGDQYPLFANVRRQQHEYRAGFEVKLSGWRLNLLHSWVNFKEDTPVTLGGPSEGYDPADATTAQAFHRREPYRGNSPYWRIVLFKESRLWSVNGHFTYVKGQRQFVQDSTGFGTDRFGEGVSQQIFASGDASRPAAAGNLTFSVFPTAKLTLTNQTSISHIRMQGRSVLTQLTNGVPNSPQTPFEFLGIRTIANSTDVDYLALSWMSLRVGYQYSTRRIRSQQSSPTINEQSNALQVGRAGVRMRPAKGLSFHFDGEIARSDRPFLPVSDRNFEAFAARAEYRRGAFRFAGNVRTRYNVNTDTLSSFASHSRQFGADVTWTGSRTFFIDVSYAKIHLDTLGTLNYFARLTGPMQLVSDRSYYVSNLHTANVAAHVTLRNRVDLSLGLSHVQDLGDGRLTATGAAPYGLLPGFQAAQTFPVRFTSPQVKASVRLRENLRWNIGYQHYGYAEEFSAAQDFRAHTGYSSLTFAF